MKNSVKMADFRNFHEKIKKIKCNEGLMRIFNETEMFFL